MRICLSNRFPGDAEASGPGVRTLRTTILEPCGRKQGQATEGLACCAGELGGLTQETEMIRRAFCKYYLGGTVENGLEWMKLGGEARDTKAPTLRPGSGTSNEWLETPVKKDEWIWVRTEKKKAGLTSRVPVDSGGNQEER